MTRRTGILSIDEGTTGTRAAWVAADGTVGGLHYERLTVNAPAPGVVEQDAAEILTKTIAAVRAALRDAQESGVEVVALAIATQRATTVLWDAESGAPLTPAVVWQDTRHAAELATLAPTWDETLIPLVGRPVGVRSPYLTVRRLIDSDAAVAEAYRAGRLRFGTVDSWLIWNLVQGHPHVVSATNATSSGAYVLAEHRYATDYLDALGFPRELLPEIVDDAADLGHTDPDLVGINVPVLAALGDQHAAMVGLGMRERGQAMCVHGTGSFVDLNLGERVPAHPGLHQGALALVAWRANGQSRFTVETFTATTGSALDWLCSTLGWFEDAKAISAAAADATRAPYVQFIPAMTGVRMPVVDPAVRATLAGVDFATTKQDVALGVLDGIAQSVAWSLEADAQVAGIDVASVSVGGGLAASDPLLQLQADLTQVPQRRMRESEFASLRGAAFLAGLGRVWTDLDEALALLQVDAEFVPSISADHRDERVGTWRARVDSELRLTHNQTEEH